MTEFSGLWNTGGAGDGASTYTRANWSLFFQIMGACMDDEGVASGYLNALAGSTTGANNARIATGGALVDGKLYNNSANVDTVIPSAVGGGNTRIDRIVLRADWTAQTVRITRIAGTDAASPTAPAITQSSGTTYDILLYQALVNTSGTVTMTDERTFAKPGTNTIVTAAITDSAVTSAKIAADAVTTDKIPNRQREIYLSLADSATLGLNLPDGSTVTGARACKVPADFVAGSSITVKAVLIKQSSATGNIWFGMTASYGTTGEIYNNHTSVPGSAALAIPAGNADVLYFTSALLTIASAAAGDIILIGGSRTGANGSDTLTADIYLAGFIVEYTADS